MTPSPNSSQEAFRRRRNGRDRKKKGRAVRAPFGNLERLLEPERITPSA